jgi:HEAT repeat protein
LPTPLPSRGKAAFSDAEMKRRNIYEALLDRGAESLLALLAGLRDPDVRLRRNVALAFGVLSGGWWHFECGPAKVDIQPALSGLVTAFRDPDDDVRAWAAQAVGNMGANAAGAVGPLIDLLASSDAGSRLSACVALGHIGQAAGLPALRAALSDQALNRCAARSIQRIEQ